MLKYCTYFRASGGQTGLEEEEVQRKTKEDGGMEGLDRETEETEVKQQEQTRVQVLARSVGTETNTAGLVQHLQHGGFVLVSVGEVWFRSESVRGQVTVGEPKVRSAD